VAKPNYAFEKRQKEIAKKKEGREAPAKSSSERKLAAEWSSDIRQR